MTRAVQTRGRADERIVLVFDLAGRTCALPSSAVAELVFVPELSQPPGLPSFLAGFMTVDGIAVPVVDLARLLGLGAGSPDLYSPVVLMRGAEPLALLVDRVLQVRPVAASDILPVGEDTVFGGCLEAEIKATDGAVHLLSPARLLLAQESRRLAEFREREQARLAELAAHPA